MLDKDNIISTSISGAVEKISIDEKDDRKCSFMCFTLHSNNIQRADLHIANSRNSSCLPTRIHPVYLKKSQKTFYIKVTQKSCNNWYMISFIHYGSAGNQLADARGDGYVYMGA